MSEAADRLLKKAEEYAQLRAHEQELHEFDGDDTHRLTAATFAAVELALREIATELEAA